MNKSYFSPWGILFALAACAPTPQETKPNNEASATSGNPIFKGWYADPEGVVFGDKYWIYPTWSDAFEKQLFFDAFSSPDLVTWQKHARILDTTIITWARQAMWAPSIIQKEDRYYLFFSANDVQHSGRSTYDPNNDINHFGGIGVAVADAPGGPYEDYLGKPLISDFFNEAQPIDQFVFRDVDSTYYMFYGGWSHCNLGKLNQDFTGFEPWDDGSLFKEITPENYVEGPFMFLRNGIYYLMWSEGSWTQDTYQVAYSMSDRATGPYQRVGVILSSDSAVATGAGHHSVIHPPDTDDYYMVYHRRPIPNEGRDHRVTCIDRMYFNEDGTIQPVKMTFEGVEPHLLSATGNRK